MSSAENVAGRSGNSVFTDRFSLQDNGYTRLILACERGEVQVAEHELDVAANRMSQEDLRDVFLAPALDAFILHLGRPVTTGHLEVLCLLMKHGLDVDGIREKTDTSYMEPVYVHFLENCRTGMPENEVRDILDGYCTARCREAAGVCAELVSSLAGYANSPWVVDAGFLRNGCFPLHIHTLSMGLEKGNLFVIPKGHIGDLVFAARPYKGIGGMDSPSMLRVYLLPILVPMLKNLPEAGRLAELGNGLFRLELDATGDVLIEVRDARLLKTRRKQIDALLEKAEKGNVSESVHCLPEVVGVRMDPRSGLYNPDLALNVLLRHIYGCTPQDQRKAYRVMCHYIRQDMRSAKDSYMQRWHKAHDIIEGLVPRTSTGFLAHTEEYAGP